MNSDSIKLLFVDCWLCIRLYTVCAYADSGRMLEHIPGLPDLILFWMNDVSVIRVSRGSAGVHTCIDVHSVLM